MWLSPPSRGASPELEHCRRLPLLRIARLDLTGAALWAPSSTPSLHLPLVLPPLMVGYCCCCCFGPRTHRFLGWSVPFGIELIFTRNGAALATAVMSFH